MLVYQRVYPSVTFVLSPLTYMCDKPRPVRRCAEYCPCLQPRRLRQFEHQAAPKTTTSILTMGSSSRMGVILNSDGQVFSLWSHDKSAWAFKRSHDSLDNSSSLCSLNVHSIRNEHDPSTRILDLEILRDEITNGILPAPCVSGTNLSLLPTVYWILALDGFLQSALISWNQQRSHRFAAENWAELAEEPRSNLKCPAQWGDQK